MNPVRNLAPLEAIAIKHTAHYSVDNRGCPSPLTGRGRRNEHNREVGFMMHGVLGCGSNVGSASYMPRQARPDYMTLKIIEVYLLISDARYRRGFRRWQAGF